MSNTKDFDTLKYGCPWIDWTPKEAECNALPYPDKGLSYKKCEESRCAVLYWLKQYTEIWLNAINKLRKEKQ